MTQATQAAPLQTIPQTTDERPNGSHFKSAEAHAAAKAEYLARTAEKRARQARNARRYFDGELRTLNQKVGY